MRVGLFSAGAICALIAPTVAIAQTPQMPQVGAGRQFDFGARIEAFYDSNLARGSEALASRRGVSRDDYVLRPTFSADISQPLGRQVLYLKGAAGYQFHRENAQLDRGRADITGGHSASVGPCQTSAFGSYRAAQSDLTDADDVTVRNLLDTVTTGVGAQCGRRVGPRFSVLALRDDTKNSAQDRKTSDNTRERLDVSLGYSHPTLGEAAIVYSYTDTEFPNRLNPGRPVGDGFWTQSFGASYKRNIGSRISVDVLASRTEVKREFAPPGTPLKFTSTTYGANLAYRLGTRLDLRGSIMREIRPSNRPGKVYDLAQSGEIVANYRLGTRYAVSLGHRIDDIDSNDDTAVLGRPVVTDARSNTTFGSIRYRQSDRLSLLLDARYEERRTNLPDFNYNSTRIGLSANVGF